MIRHRLEFRDAVSCDENDKTKEKEHNLEFIKYRDQYFSSYYSLYIDDKKICNIRKNNLTELSKIINLMLEEENEN